VDGEKRDKMDNLDDGNARLGEEGLEIRGIGSNLYDYLPESRKKIQN